MLTPTGRLGTLAVSPDGNWIVTGSARQRRQVWDADSGQQARRTLSGHVAEVSAMAFSPDGDGSPPATTAATSALAQAARPGRQLDVRARARGHSGSITALRFTPDGQRLVSASGDHTCGQWDVATGQEERELVLKHPD